MKEFVVKGYAFIPVEVEIKTFAKNAVKALKQAEEAFKKGPKRFLVAGSEDRSAAFDFKPNSAEEQ